MYSRSYDVEYNKLELEVFKAIVQNFMDKNGYYIHISNYPYNTHYKKRVNTIHITVRYYTIESLPEEIRPEARNKLWFDIQENSEDRKSIPDIRHFHAIKKL